VIERRITATGSTYNFRAKPEEKVFFTKRDELNQILEHFNITIDSPLTVLTQDAARSFLAHANDASLYEVMPRKEHFDVG
jgi:hypothetical protein